MNDDAIKAHRAVGVALAPLSHQRSDGARSPAGTVAADRVLSTAKTVIVAGTDDAGIELGELAPAVDTTSTQPAGIEHRALGVELAPRGTALAITTFEAR